MSDSNPLEVTPEAVGSQTVGPFYSIGLGYLVSEFAAGPQASGTHITLAGTLYDAAGVPVPDAIIETWQADPLGKFPAHVPLPSALQPQQIAGFARLSTHQDGRFLLNTVLPGQVPYADGRVQAPHLLVLIFMRGVLRHLVTRVYFPGDPANESDPVLLLVPEDRRKTLIAERIEAKNLRWDIHLQGEEETVFFDA